MDDLDYTDMLDEMLVAIADTIEDDPIEDDDIDAIMEEIEAELGVEEYSDLDDD